MYIAAKALSENRFYQRVIVHADPNCSFIKRAHSIIPLEEVNPQPRVTRLCVSCNRNKK